MFCLVLLDSVVFLFFSFFGGCRLLDPEVSRYHGTFAAGVIVCPIYKVP